MTIVTGPALERALRVADANLATNSWGPDNLAEHYPGELTDGEPDGTLPDVSLRERNPSEAKSARA